ncbi:MAG: lactonase family protein [Candidatus Merdivicinus sp.]|jgi:6-phosphogluconolactonase
MNAIYMSGYGSDRMTIQGYSEGQSIPFWQDSPLSPSYFIFGDGFLFTAEERSDGGAVCLYQKETDRWRQSDRRVITGSELCHITYSDRHHCLLGACYGTGEVFSLSVDLDHARFGSMKSYLRQGKSGGNGMPISRAHCVVLNQEQNFVCSANIAQDKIYLYRMESDGRLSEHNVFSLPAKCGPRHIALREDLNRAYVVTEYSSEILVVSYESSPSVLQRVAMVEKGFSGESFGSTLVFSPDGKFLYAANRGENTIVAFSVSRTGRLVLSGRYSCWGNWPRDFSLIGEDQIAIANQRSGEVVICPRNPHTGAVGEPAYRFSIPEASCVKEYQGV